MDGQKVLEVIDIYRKFFAVLGVSKRKASHNKMIGVFLQENDLVLAHCHGMLDQMEQFVAEGRMDKVFRWLGFVQGCLWSAGYFSLEELKNHNRPDTTE